MCPMLACPLYYVFTHAARKRSHVRTKTVCPQFRLLCCTTNIRIRDTRRERERATVCWCSTYVHSLGLSGVSRSNESHRRRHFSEDYRRISSCWFPRHNQYLLSISLSLSFGHFDPPKCVVSFRIASPGETSHSAADCIVFD